MNTVYGIGLGFRKEIAEQLLEETRELPHFIELAPENWMGLGGKMRQTICSATSKYTTIAHGLSLSLGSPEPLDWDFLKEIKVFLKEFSIRIYSEHLSYTKCDNAHLYDLLPLPFTEDAVKHVAKRIRQVQDFLEREIAIENVSYYTTLIPEMDEATFLREIVIESDCKMLLDVNNVYVNAFNHGYDPHTFIQSLPLDRVVCIHMAGHLQEDKDLIIDTHGEDIVDPVYELFEWTAQRMPHEVPVLLERDFNLENYESLIGEMSRLQVIAKKAWRSSCAVG